MKKLIILILIAGSGQAFAQGNLGFFQMANVLPQGANYNPAYFPDARVYVSLPGISGVDLSMYNSFGVNDILTETGDSTLIDIGKLLSTQQGKNAYFNSDSRITNLMVGFRVGEANHFSVFINERVESTLFYPVELMNFLWQGNAAYVGQNFVTDQFSAKSTYFREWGVGYGRSLKLLGRELTIGARLKYLSGMVHLEASDVSVSILTDEDYTLTASWNDPQIQLAGRSLFEDEMDPEYLVINGNNGFGIDLGATFQFSRKLGFGLAINDLGFINWKEGSENMSFTRNSITYAGIDLDNTDSFGEALMDSIDNIESEFEDAPFTTSLNSRTYLSADYQLNKNGFAKATLANYVTQGRLRTSFGLGYSQHVGKWFMASATTSYVPQQGVDLGLGVMFRLSAFQLYFAADNLINSLDIPEATAANFKVGLNLLFGRTEKKGTKKVIPAPSQAPPESIPEEEDYSGYEHLWK